MVNLLAPLSNRGWVQRVAKSFDDDPIKAMAKATITTIVVKDAIGCGMYVYQSATNKNIPPERRNFVTALDLVNGGIMILTQVLMYKWISKHSEKFVKKWFKGLYDNDFAKKVKSEIRVDQKAANLNPDRGIQISDERLETQKKIVDLAKNVIDLVATTIGAKRVVVPFIATPLAGMLQKKMDERTKAQEDATQQKLDINTSDYKSDNKKVSVK